MIKGEIIMSYFKRIFKGYIFWFKYLYILDIVFYGYIKFLSMILCRWYLDFIIFKFGVIRDFKMNGFFRIIRYVFSGLSVRIIIDYIFFI